MPGKIRWVLYLILGTLIVAVIGAMIFKVDRIVVAQGELITTTPTIVVQPLSTRSCARSMSRSAMSSRRARSW